MGAATAKKEQIAQLQAQIWHMQGLKPALHGQDRVRGLEAIAKAFPNSIFPVGALHEFLNFVPEHAAATQGFIAGILQQLMRKGHACIWIAEQHELFPPALAAFGADPSRVIFLHLKHSKDILWACEEALKCEGIAAVVVEIGTLDMVISRRLQLAVEKSGVTGFILRTQAKGLSTTMAAARWQISPLPSIAENGLPGVGHPHWQVDLLKVRNGKPGRWEVMWEAQAFKVLEKKAVKVKEAIILKTG